MNRRGETGIGPALAGGDRPELLDSCEDVLDLVPPFAHLPVMIPGLGTAPPRGNHRRRSGILDLLDQPFGIESLVADKGTVAEILQKCRHAGEIMRLAGKDNEPHGKSQGVHDGHDLAGQAAT